MKFDHAETKRQYTDEQIRQFVRPLGASLLAWTIAAVAFWMSALLPDAAGKTHVTSTDFALWGLASLLGIAYCVLLAIQVRRVGGNVLLWLLLTLATCPVGPVVAWLLVASDARKTLERRARVRAAQAAARAEGTATDPPAASIA